MDQWNFHFFFVQLAPYVQGSYPILPQLRQAQLAALALPNTGVATAVDAGDDQSPEGIIHPRDKEIVGYRLFLNAQALVYGGNLPYLGPMFPTWEALQTVGTTVSASVTFDSSSVENGLYLKKGRCPGGPVPESGCGWPMLQTSDGKWNNATITVTGTNTVQFTATASTASVTVVGISYAYNDWPIATIYNSFGLPALPFYFAESGNFKKNNENNIHIF